MGEVRVEVEGGVAAVLLDGFPQSAVDLDDPTVLHFEYVQQLALVVDALAPAGTLRVTHVGGGGLTLPRWVHATRPGSPQIVLEPDVALTEQVRRDVPLPRGHRMRVRPVGGEEGVAALADGSADVVVLDAFVDGRVPAGLTTVEWMADVRRVLAPAGLLLANVTDEPGMRYAARVAAGAQEVFGHTAFVGLHEVLKGRRFGNVVLVASPGPLDLYTLRRAAASAVLPTGVLPWADVARRVPGARPLRSGDGTAVPSPEPPDPGGWRVR
ncbi:spermidine synthase [Phycicoccus jejuensis]|uniref:spermidine synthase n=1 Tax=Phycicoccus jejuensis TaxID=367299 RepID=UPI0004C3F609|nr:fused MFS/spermidine synthase [Phycicoccus jejuensis]